MVYKPIIKKQEGMLKVGQNEVSRGIRVKRSQDGQKVRSKEIILQRKNWEYVLMQTPESKLEQGGSS